MRRLSFYPPLSELVGVRGRPKRWLGGTGFQPHYENIQHKRYKPVDIPWRLSEPFLDAREPLELVVFDNQFSTIGQRLRELGASTKKVLFARPEDNFNPPMVILNEGFTKFAFCSHRVFFQNALRSISGPEIDEDLLRFLTAVLDSRLMQYLAFHSGSSNGIGREKLHLYESLGLPFPLPDHDLAPSRASEIVKEAASVLKQVERAGKNATAERRTSIFAEAKELLEPLVENYFCVTDAERILIEDTLSLNQPSIHRTNLDTDIPSLAFPEPEDRKRYAEVLCEVLNRRARKHGIKIHAEGQISKALNLIFLTVIFSDAQRAYTEKQSEEELWAALNRIGAAAQYENRSFSYLRGFSYFDSDRLHMLKPATMRNWSRTAALNDADAIFEHLVGRTA
jgi:hypothetical protein